MTEGDRLPLVIAARAPALAVRIAAGYLRFLGVRRSGVRAFRQALLASGMSPTQADRLAGDYREAGSLARILRRMGAGGRR